MHLKDPKTNLHHNVFSFTPDSHPYPFATMPLPTTRDGLLWRCPCPLISGVLVVIQVANRIVRCGEMGVIELFKG